MPGLGSTADVLTRTRRIFIKLRLFCQTTLVLNRKIDARRDSRLGKVLSNLSKVLALKFITNESFKPLSQRLVSSETYSLQFHTIYGSTKPLNLRSGGLHSLHPRRTLLTDFADARVAAGKKTQSSVIQ